MPSPAVGADLKSAHKPGLVLEAALSLQKSELNTPIETRPNNVTVTMDTEAGNATITATLPITVAIDATGQAIVQAVDYIP